jgi:hypothetical protein
VPKIDVARSDNARPVKLTSGTVVELVRFTYHHEICILALWQEICILDVHNRERFWQEICILDVHKSERL